MQAHLLHLCQVTYPRHLRLQLCPLHHRPPRRRSRLTGHHPQCTSNPPSSFRRWICLEGRRTQLRLPRRMRRSLRFGDLNRSILGPSDNGHIIILSDFKEEEEVCEIDDTDAKVVPSSTRKSSAPTASTVDKVQNDSSDAETRPALLRLSHQKGCL
jgi:hypothetical protein